MIGSREAKKNPLIRDIVRKYVGLLFIYILFFLPTLLLFLLTLVNEDIELNSFKSWLSYYATLANMSRDFALCSVRILFGHVQFGCLKRVIIIAVKIRKKKRVKI